MTFYFENDVNVASKSNKQNKLDEKIIFSYYLEGYWQKYQDLDPDPNLDLLVRCMDPRIRIRTNMSRIRNIDYSYSEG
jgi:hypothetical protein